MAVVAGKFNEIHTGRDADDEATRKTGVKRYTRVFRVRTDTNTDDGKVCLDHEDCPDLGDEYPTDSDAYCRRRRARQESFSKLVWIVTCAYSTGDELEENPLNDPAKIDWTTETFQRVFDQDRDGEAILNSAGDGFDPPVMGDDSRWVANVTKNVSAVPSWILSYRDAVNSDQFTLDGLTIPVGTAKMQRIRISGWQERNDVAFRVLTMAISFNESGWAKVLLDQGFRELDTCDTTCGSAADAGSGSGSGDCDAGRRHILDTNCDPVVSPVPLDGSGCALACPTPSTASFRTYSIYATQAFASLPLT